MIWINVLISHHLCNKYFSSITTFLKTLNSATSWNCPLLAWFLPVCVNPYCSLLPPSLPFSHPFYPDGSYLFLWENVIEIASEERSPKTCLKLCSPNTVVYSFFFYFIQKLYPRNIFTREKKWEQTLSFPHNPIAKFLLLCFYHTDSRHCIDDYDLIWPFDLSRWCKNASLPKAHASFHQANGQNLLST